VEERADAVPLDIAEAKKRTLQKNVAQLRAQQQQQQAAVQQQRSRQTTAVSGRKSSASTEPNDGPASKLGLVGTAKPAIDIMRPLVAAILQENEQVMKSLDPRKDVVVSFVELCKSLVPEEMCVRVFDALSSQASQLVDTMVKNPAEFWRVWTLYCPALVEYSENSPVFASVVFLFKRLGSLIGEVDPILTQQLMVDVAIPSLAPLLVDSAGKREPLCELVYTYTQPAVVSRLGVLRNLKEAIADLGVYIACLSYFVSLELREGLFDEHLLETYMYYAHVAVHFPQAKLRVAGLSILVTLTSTAGDHYQSVLTLLPSFLELVHDDWWEVQAQLLILASQLLLHAGEANARRNLPDEESPGEDGERSPGEANEEAVESLLGIVGRLFDVGTSKIVLQVGLCSLGKILRLYPSLLPAYTDVLLRQPSLLRRRILEPTDAELDGGGEATRRLVYVMGTSTRTYEECWLPSQWPALDIARTLVAQSEAAVPKLAHFESEHLEVLSAALPEPDVDLEDEWLEIFEKAKEYILIALIDPVLHEGATDVVRRFWLCRPMNTALRALEASKKTLLQTWIVMYGSSNQERVPEADLLNFLCEMRNTGGAIADMLQQVVDQFRESHNVEFQRSQLDSLFE